LPLPSELPPTWAQIHKAATKWDLRFTSKNARALHRRNKYPKASVEISTFDIISDGGHVFFCY
jgi:hypothetical protein